MTYRATLRQLEYGEVSESEAVAESPTLAVAAALSLLGIAERPLSYQARYTAEDVLVGFDLGFGIFADVETIH